MSVKLLTEYHLEFPSLKGGCTCLYESTLVKMPQCWKSHVKAHSLWCALKVSPWDASYEYPQSMLYWEILALCIYNLFIVLINSIMRLLRAYGWKHIIWLLWYQLVYFNLEMFLIFSTQTFVVVLVGSVSVRHNANELPKHLISLKN